MEKAAQQRYAVVTGSNKGIGFEIVRQLASNGIKVVLTSRDEKRGLEAVEKLKSDEYGLSSDKIIFHQLDVSDPASISSLADFIKNQFGKLDILVNNAGIAGVILDADAYTRATKLAGGDFPDGEDYWNEIETTSIEGAKECLNTNYYGAKRMVEAFVPLLRLSDSARIVNVSSLKGLLKYIPNESIRQALNDVESLTEERIDKLSDKYLQDFEEGLLEKEGWSSYLSAYTVSKALLNAYTRILARKYTDFLVNCVCPGFAKTDITCDNGVYTAAEGAQGPVRLALLPEGRGGPSDYSASNPSSKSMAELTKRYAVVTGANKGIGHETVRQLALNGVVVVLTARDEKRGLEAVEKLKEESGLSDDVFLSS
ncbi:hypothetical protein Q3G72_023019 [Acer saccharum]|nr:hypothetical protein Q3G72_023019 [Acer saccharum]